MPSSQQQSPTPETVLEALTQGRLMDLLMDLRRTFGIGLHSGREAKGLMTLRLGQQLKGCLPLQELGRDELRSVCRTHGVSDDGRSRVEFQARILEAAGLDPGKSIPPAPEHHLDGLPQPGPVVQARHRRWMVEAVLYVLHAERAAEEEPLGLTKRGKKKKPAKKKASRKMIETPTLPGMEE